MSQEKADHHLSVAKKHLDRVLPHIWDPDDEDRETAVTWAFYTYENLIVAAAEKANIGWRMTHWSKQEVAEEIHKRGLVSVNVRDRLDELNELRKDVQYGEAGPDLKSYDLEDLANELEAFFDEVEKFVAS
jgi:hypothetical protein